jgi:ribosomal protein L37AE/L43A
MNREPTQDEIDRIASALVVRKRVKESSGLHAICDCPACGKQKHLYLNLGSGLWDCKRCGEAGSIWKLADRLGIRLRDRTVVRSAMAAVTMPGKRFMPTRVKSCGVALVDVERAAMRIYAEGDDDGAAVLAYLHGRGIDDAAIQHFRLGVAYIKTGGGKERAVGIPYVDGETVLLVKMRNLEEDKEKRRFQRTKGGESALFNAAGVRDRRRVVLVEGELDAISLWQSGITETASTSLGAKGDVPQAWKEILADADDVVLWYDDDEAGDEAVDGLATALGTHRVRIASVPPDLSAEVAAATGKRPKDVNDLVRAKVDPERIRAVVDAAVPLETARVVQPGAYSDHLTGLIDRGAASLGEPTGWIGLDKLLRGWRPGELTVVTGHTSHGKSTWTSFALGLLARRGYPVLLSSLEDGPDALARKVFQRIFGRPISSIVTEQDREDAMRAIGRLNEDPIYVFDHYGRVSFSEVVDAVTYAARRLGCKYVEIDHLHFISRHPDVEEREHLDRVCMDLVQLAVQLGIHIFLIAHPRGAIELATIPTGDALKGSSSIKQVAHNGVTVYRVTDAGGADAAGQVKLKDAAGRRVEIPLEPSDVLLYVWKARHDDAREGMAVLKYDGRCLSYQETAEPQSESEAARWGEREPDAYAAAETPDLFGGTR